MVIRAASESDLPGIFAIYDREVLHGTCTFDTIAKSETERLDWYRADGGGRYPILVAQEAGRLAGWARLYAWSPRPAYNRTAENAVYVDEAFRGRGAARLLMTELLRLAGERGIRVVIARVVEGNPASRALHEAMGFSTIGIMHGVGEKFGRVLDVRLMERQIP